VNVEDLPEYAKVPEVAKVLGLSEASVWRLVWAGELPSIRLGERSVRVPRAGLADYLANRPAAVASA
jgi:excisionase family DNA binding protein